jgi:hypothetical protein
MENFKFTDDQVEEIDIFLSLYADDIYSDCRLRKLVNIEDSEEQSKLFLLLDFYLNKITQKFEFELLIEKSPELIQFFALRHKKRKKVNIMKKIALNKKLSKYYFGYQPSIHYLFKYKIDLQLKVVKYRED